MKSFPYINIMFEKHLWHLAKSLVCERPEIETFRATDINF